MSSRNNISQGVDWTIVWVYAILVSIGILCIFMVEYRTDTNWLQTFLGGKTNYSKQLIFAGSIEWDGADPHYLTLRNVTKGAKVARGDTVVTSNYSANFPPSLMIGTVADISSESASNFYTLKIKTSTNFFSLRYVYLIQNVRYTEQVQLENNTPKNP